MSSTNADIGRRLQVPGFLAMPYDDCAFFQSQSTDLVVFSPSAGEYVTIAWPTYHGRRILPHRIKEWLRNHGLHWSCFCSLTSGESRSTRIVEALSGSVFAFCNDRSSVCGFRINLSRVYESAAYESDYDNLPLLSTGDVPDMERLRSQFRTIESTRRGPYFRGYCGEHESEYHGTIQLAGASLVERGPPTPYDDACARRRARLDEESQRIRATIIPPRPTSLAFTRIRGRPNVSAGPSTVQVHNLGVPSVREQGIIDRLQVGEGVLAADMTSLFEKCTLCDHYFVASLLRLHIRGCAPDL